MQHGSKDPQVAAESATETVKSEGGEHVDQLDSAREHVNAVRE